MIATPTELEYFIETYKTEHVSRAAVRLNVTQPTLTQAIQRLEEKLGHKLFFRTKQGVTPTKEGIIFYQSAKELLEKWEDIQTSINSSATELKGSFKLGIHPSVAAYILPDFFKILDKEAPQIEIQLIHDLSRKILEQVLSHEIDFGIVINPVKHPDLVLKKLLNDEVKFWVNKSIKKIPERIFVDTSLHQTEALINKTFKKYFSNWKITSTSNLELIRTMALSGAGIAILPERVAKVDNIQLVEYNKTLPVFSDELYLAYKVGAMNSFAAKTVLKMFR
jgi:DNA-binding transcriptional LysR family regulator